MECCSIAVATHGCASCRSAARPAARKSADSRSTFQIVESGLKTFYKEVCLLDQPFIFDDKKTVAQALKESEGKVGGAIKVGGFVRYALGEGIERPAGDFGGEVAALAGA